MSKTLGLDLGTNSIGWAIVERNDTECTLKDKGVTIFQEGVAREKESEKPAVQDRTAARALRRHYFRRRLRKIELLKVLIRHGLCPPLTDEQLVLWRTKKIYPTGEEFIRWQRTDDNEDKNPYHDRYRALTEVLDLRLQSDRYVLGRALYHLGQRRGFLSNRREAAEDSESGKVKEGIATLNNDMAAAGCRYLGEYFYRLYRDKRQIRARYTSRNEHYLKEFEAIVEKQRLPEELHKALRRAIFYQRDLKSQKGLVGRCTFEKGKSRCPVSHPRFEEFRMLSFVNNIRIQSPDDAEPRPLRPEEREKIASLFLRKSKPQFDFEEIAKRIAGKGRYACKGDRTEAACRFNFSRSTSVSGCPVTAELKEIFGEEWLPELCALYTLGAGKNGEQILNDVWHALFSFTDEVRLRAWAQEKLQLSEKQAAAFAAIRLPRDYAALSLNAIGKILPYLRSGYRYDEAVFMANLRSVLPAGVWADESKRHEIEADVAAIIEDFPRNPLNRNTTKEQCIEDYLRGSWAVDNRRLERLYHPSMIETYPDARPDTRGMWKLGSPRTSAVRNPMAMRALFRLRILINRLLREGKIDRTTKINIEFARELNDANRRKAIERYQREREAENKKYAEKIREAGIEPTEEDILKYRLWVEQSQDDCHNERLKYRLWEEQKHLCLYTGKSIGLHDFLGASPSYDIEHTLPRSRGGDNSQMNKTLCQNYFNREIKRAKLPSELANHAEIMARVEALGWQEKIDSLQRQVEGLRRKSKKTGLTKEAKDSLIQQRHLRQMELDYWRGKYERLVMTEIPEGFSNRQGVDIGIVGKYARLYLKTVFERIRTVKGSTTSDFRKMWGLQEEFEKKARENHIHHCIDAITIACIGHREYDEWARYVGDEERYRRGEGAKPNFEKPWPTFTEDVKAVAEEVLVSHHTPDNMAKQTRKKLRVRGKVKLNAQGEPIYIQGDTARGRLHRDTFYGAIKRDGAIKYVLRKSLDKLKPEDVEKIVDEEVKRKVKEAIDAVGFKAAMNTTIWMNEEKRIPIRKVRIFTPSVTRPIELKQHRDLSDKTYKQDYHVANDSNYCMAIYEGCNRKGQVKRSFEIVNNMEAAQYFKYSSDKTMRPCLVPPADENGFPLKWLLKTGTMVLFYEKSPAELFECSQEELVKRLYKVKELDGRNERFCLTHHQEARQPKELNKKAGVWKIGETYRPIIQIRYTQLQAYVEGYDFELTVTGEIKFKLERPC